jgi:hypothetical protein
LRLEQPALRARVAFGLVAELTSQTFYEKEYESAHSELAEQLLQTALAHFRTRALSRPRAID